MKKENAEKIKKRATLYVLWLGYLDHAGHGSQAMLSL